MPLSPYCFHVRPEGISVFDAVPMAVVTLPKEAGMGWPARRSSSGLGSKRSRWLGPPSMNSQMTDLAVGAWSGFLGASGSTGRAPCSMEETTTAPRPPQDRIRNSRRLLAGVKCLGRILVPIHEFVGVQQHLAEIHESGGVCRLHAFRN